MLLQRRVRASDALTAEAERFANMGTWQWNVKTGELVWSDQVCRIFGVEPGSSPDFASYLGMVHPDDRGALLTTIQTASKPGSYYRIQHRLVRQCGEIRVVLAQGEVKFSPSGEPLRMVGVCQDVTELVHLQDEAEEGRRQQRELLDSLFAFVGVLSLEGELLDANRAAIEGLGQTRDELVGRQLWETPYWRYDPTVQAAIQDAILRASRGEFVRGDFVANVGAGNFLTVDAVFGPLRDRDGRTRCVVASAVDVTERVTAERASRKVRGQLEHAQRIANVGSWEWEFADGQLLWSEQCYRIVGWPIGSPVSIERFLQIVHPGDRGLVEKVIREGVETGASCELDHRIVLADGEVRIVHQRGEVERDAAGHAQRMIGTTQDVTLLRRTREELLDAKLRAEAANHAKSQFVANMSHELRTPLNAIIGFSELLQSEDTGFSEERRREYARDIHSSGKHLLSVINDILDVSRIEAGKVTLEDDDIAIEELTEAALRMVKTRADETGVTVHCTAGADVRVVADRRLLLQALLNLTSNAVKFTERGGQVDVSADIGVDGGVQIAVRDTGIGMSKDDIARVGEPFLQVDGRLARKFEGTGLGLVIAKRLIEMHGGTLVIDSALGRGTTMTISLPASRTVHQAGDARAAAC